jgi:hypothetical protein
MRPPHEGHDTGVLGDVVRWMAMAGGGGLDRASLRGHLPYQELLDDLCM